MNDRDQSSIIVHSYHGVTVDREYVIRVARNRNEAEAIPLRRDDVNDRKRRGRACCISAFTINEC